MRRSACTWTLFLAAALVNGLLLWHFHDRYWYPTDDGFYAHIAERVLSGAVLNRDVQDIHPGYIHYLHAAAFRLFGLDLVSLRYPLILAALVQACLVFAFLERRDILLAAIGSVAITALGVVQFFDPTPNWYCLVLCVMLGCWMTWLPPAHRARLIGAGGLLGVLTLFRQLSGVWAAMGLLVFVLLERSDSRRTHGGWVARGLLLIMMLALVGYLAVSPETEPGGVLLMAVWPLSILGWTLFNERTTNVSAASAVGQVALGTAVPAIPLLVYHAAHGSLGGWFNDTVLAGFGETQMAFFGHGWYGVLPLAGLYQAVSSFDPAKIANGLYWVVLPLLAAANGILILRRLHRTRSVGELAMPLLASFYALVSLYLEGPLYLYYAVGLNLVAVLWLGASDFPKGRVAGLAMAAGLSVVAVVFHAGQSRLRTPVEILKGDRSSSVWTSDGEGLDRCRLRLDRADHALYGRIVKLIQAHTARDESIFALPNDAELYFLAARPNPFRFYNSALGIRTDEELAAVVQELDSHPPRLVAFRPSDKYNTDQSRHIMDIVRTKYVRIETMDGLEMYTLR